MIVGEYEQRAVYKCYNVAGNSPDLKLLVRFIMLISKYNWGFYGRDEPYFVCTHSASAGDGHRNQSILTWYERHRDDIGGSSRVKPFIARRFGWQFSISYTAAGDSHVLHNILF